MSRIPLRARDGSVRAWATVDEVDFERFGHLYWHLSAHGYVVRQEYLGGGRYRSLCLGREVLGISDDANLEADHVNRDKLDNRRSNLRPASRR